ncbi:MAG: molybdopterin-binding protein [Candidatus Bathyarchaeia archaeon]
MGCIVEIIGVGNELLIGKIANTNAQWLAKTITNLGGEVRRIVDVGDNLDEISAAIREALARAPTWLIVTGGLGPTFDDMTLEGIAKALAVPLKLDEEAKNMVNIELTPARLKMATLPLGGKPLRNPAGTAPGLMIRSGLTTIVALPGVPIEMQTIFKETLEPLIRETAGERYVYSKYLRATGVIESTLAPLIDLVMHDNPGVYVKSHPKEPEPLPVIEFHISSYSRSLELSRKKVEDAAAQLSRLVHEKKGKVEEIEGG